MAETIQAYASVIGIVLALIGLPLVLLQLAELQRSARASAHAAIYEHEIAFRTQLVAYPELRKYFFDDVDIAPDNKDFARVVTLAECFLNYLEHLVLTLDSVGRHNRPSIERFVRDALSRSPVLRREIDRNRARFSDALVRFAEANNEADAVG